MLERDALRKLLDKIDRRLHTAGDDWQAHTKAVAEEFDQFDQHYPSLLQDNVCVMDKQCLRTLYQLHWLRKKLNHRVSVLERYHCPLEPISDVSNNLFYRMSRTLGNETALWRATRALHAEEGYFTEARKLVNEGETAVTQHFRTLAQLASYLTWQAQSRVYAWYIEQAKKRDEARQTVDGLREVGESSGKRY